MPDRLAHERVAARPVATQPDPGESQLAQIADLAFLNTPVGEGIDEVAPPPASAVAAAVGTAALHRDAPRREVRARVNEREEGIYVAPVKRVVASGVELDVLA